MEQAAGGLQWWHLATAANLVIAGAYYLIAWAIAVPLIESRQVRANRLGTATALIFFTCGIGHTEHFAHLIGPSFGVEEATGEAMRATYSFHMALFDGISAVVGVYYWSLRKTYGSLMKGAALFEDLRERQRQALELNDNVVQGLTVAKMALELGEHDKGAEALEHALGSASRIISDLLATVDGESAGDLDLMVRKEAAVIRKD